MSTDKYAQFIAEQQRKLSVSGTNTVDLHEGAKPEVSVHSGAAHVKNAKGETVASYSRKQHGADFMKKANAHMAKLKEETLEEKKERSPDYLATIHKDDPDYDKKIADLKSKHKLRIRGRDAAPEHKAKYRKGGELYRSSSLDIKPEHSKRVDVYTRGVRKEEAELIDEKERTADELKSKIKQHRLGHHVTPETDWPKKRRHLQATSAAERMLAKLPRSKGGESVTKQGINPVGATKTQWKNKKWNEEVELDDTMIEENVIELAEAMKKGELGEKSRFHRENARYHEKMSGKHAVMADKAEQMGDEHGFDHHYGESIHHEMEAGRHHNLADRADALRDKVKARKDSKDASERLAKANAARKDIGY